MVGSELVACPHVENTEKEECGQKCQQKHVVHNLASPTSGLATGIIGREATSGNQ